MHNRAHKKGKAKKIVRPLPRRSAYTIREARQLLGDISQATIYAMFRRGDLRSFKIGRRRLVSDDAIRDCIAAGENETA